MARTVTQLPAKPALELAPKELPRLARPTVVNPGGKDTYGVLNAPNVKLGSINMPVKR